MKMKSKILGHLPLLVAGMFATTPTWAEDGKITLIHMGDIHGHLIERPNLRSDGDGRMEGGLARMYKEIEKIRKKAGHSLLLNTGDTIQGSGEALFTKGQALVEVLDMFGIDAYTPGNWDFVYGPERFKELFVNTASGKPEDRRWSGLAANLYYANTTTHVLPPYMIKQVGRLKIGIIGCTTQRGPQVVGNWVVAGLKFTDCTQEVATYVAHLRRIEQVDLVVLISELELARNIQMVENNVSGVDVVLSSDMHEETTVPIEVFNKKTGHRTLLVEEGQDGTMIGEFKLEIEGGKLTEWEWQPHRIYQAIEEDKKIAAKVAAVRAPFVSGRAFKTDSVNPFNGTVLKRPLDTVVGETRVALYRGNFTDEALPGVIEGTSHDWIADAMRWKAASDLATIRGFRYGTHVKPGAITMNDLYHFVPIGPRLAKVVSKITPVQLKTQIENSSKSVFSTDPTTDWRGGWMFGYSGAEFDLNVYAPNTALNPKPLRGTNVVVHLNGVPTQIIDADGNWTPAIKGVDGNGAAYDFSNTPLFTVAGYWYAQNPDTINGCDQCAGGTITPIDDAHGQALDVVEVLVEYLQAKGPANPLTDRIHVTSSLPAPKFGFREIQPLRGAIP